MKVLKIIHTTDHGGAENIFRWLASGLVQQGIEVIAGIPINTNSANESWIEKILTESNIRYRLFVNDRNPLRLFQSIRNLIGMTRPDIVHSHLLDSNFYSSSASKYLGIPHVCTEHGDISLRRSLKSYIKFLTVSALSDAVICVSEAVRKRVARIVPFHDKLRTIHNGVNWGNADSASTLRRDLHIPDNGFLIANIGNLYPVKGQHYLIRAFSEFLSAHRNSYLVLVGRGEEKASLEKMAKSLGIPDNQVLFLGFREDIENILKATDVYVQSSLSEGHPVALLEAMASGIPVIATDVGGTREILGDKKSGLLTPPESWQGLCNCLMTVVSEIDGFRERALHDMVSIRSSFSNEKMVERYIAVYRSVLLKRAHSRHSL